jgi:hypothetical protein
MPGNAFGADFSIDDTYLAVGSSISPTLSIYKTTTSGGSDAYNKIYLAGNDIADVITNIGTQNALGYATSAGVADDEKTITAIWKEV